MGGEAGRIPAEVTAATSFEISASKTARLRSCEKFVFKNPSRPVIWPTADSTASVKVSMYIKHNSVFNLRNNKEVPGSFFFVSRIPRSFWEFFSKVRWGMELS